MSWWHSFSIQALLGSYNYANEAVIPQFGIVTNILLYYYYLFFSLIEIY